MSRYWKYLEGVSIVYSQKGLRALIRSQTKIPEMKNIITEIKNLAEMFNRRFGLAKKRNNKLEDRADESSQNIVWKGKNRNNMKERL